jgi:hypothetical protein
MISQQDEQTRHYPKRLNPQFVFIVFGSVFVSLPEKNISANTV